MDILKCEKVRKVYGSGGNQAGPGRGVLFLMHAHNLLYAGLRGTEAGKCVAEQRWINQVYPSSGSSWSFSSPLARMSQVCTVDGLARRAAAISFTE